MLIGRKGSGKVVVNLFETGTQTNLLTGSRLYTYIASHLVLPLRVFATQ
jgi:hypothetical protein